MWMKHRCDDLTLVQFCSVPVTETGTIEDNALLSQ